MDIKWLQSKNKLLAFFPKKNTYFAVNIFAANINYTRHNSNLYNHNHMSNTRDQF